MTECNYIRFLVDSLSNLFSENQNHDYMQGNGYVVGMWQ